MVICPKYEMPMKLMQWMNRDTPIDHDNTTLALFPAACRHSLPTRENAIMISATKSASARDRAFPQESKRHRHAYNRKADSQLRDVFQIADQTPKQKVPSPRRRTLHLTCLEFPGFSGDAVAAVGALLRIARGSGHRGNCDDGSDCRTCRCRRRRRSAPTLGSCRSAS